MMHKTSNTWKKKHGVLAHCKHLLLSVKVWKNMIHEDTTRQCEIMILQSLKLLTWENKRKLDIKGLVCTEILFDNKII